MSRGKNNVPTSPEKEVVLGEEPTTKTLSVDENLDDMVYIEDFEDFATPKNKANGRTGRIVALAFGFFTLIGIGIGIYFYMHRNEIIRNENYQEFVSTTELAIHNLETDCWVAYHGNVYEMTEYASIHPGKPSFITMHCGTDGTESFDSEHPISYLPIVDEYLLGTLIVNELEEAVDEQDDFIEEDDETTISASVGPSVSPATVPMSETMQPTQTPVEVVPTDTVIDGCEMQRYTISDLASHNDETSCWYGLYGVVYDFTEYVDFHPGGRGNILWACGTDATADFILEKKHDIDLLQNRGFSSYIIGRQGDTSGIEIVPCDELDVVAVNLVY